MSCELYDNNCLLLYIVWVYNEPPKTLQHQETVLKVK
jgi:hypothetical protein